MEHLLLSFVLVEEEVFDILDEGREVSKVHEDLNEGRSKEETADLIYEPIFFKHWRRVDKLADVVNDGGVQELGNNGLYNHRYQVPRLVLVLLEVC